MRKFRRKEPRGKIKGYLDKPLYLSNHKNIKQAFCCVLFNLDVKLSTFTNKIDCRAFTCRFRASLKHFLSAVFAFCIAYCFLTDFLSSFAQGLFFARKTCFAIMFKYLYVYYL